MILLYKIGMGLNLLQTSYEIVAFPKTDFPYKVQ